MPKFKSKSNCCHGMRAHCAESFVAFPSSTAQQPSSYINAHKPDNTQRRHAHRRRSPEITASCPPFSPSPKTTAAPHPSSPRGEGERWPPDTCLSVSPDCGQKQSCLCYNSRVPSSKRVTRSCRPALPAQRSHRAEGCRLGHPYENTLQH
jgi:hypothetical protein